MTLTRLFVAGLLLRAAFFLFGIYQDNNLPVKYTDIDYVVFSDAARYVYDGDSPYKRETYRYTPLLAWILVPTSWGGAFTHYGKAVFIICDVLTGLLISKVFDQTKLKLSARKYLILLSLWVLNPMVATISTRGSSESVLTFIVMLCVKQFLDGKYMQAAFWLGLSTHFKIYPIIYLPAFMYNMASHESSFGVFRYIPVLKWLNLKNLKFMLITIASFLGWTSMMYYIYGYEFLYESYLYHMTRLDHRHNFSLYNVALYYKSANGFVDLLTNHNLMTYWGKLLSNAEQFSFLPQLLLSAVVIPLLLAQEDLISCLFVQTFSFVAFNKVMTSQYFLWFLIFLPHLLANSRLTSKTHLMRGVSMVLAWSVPQAIWLYFAYRLEFLGHSTFYWGLLPASALFFLSSCWVLGQFIEYS